MRWGQFKSNLADAIVAHLEPIQQKYHDVIADKTYLDQVLPCFFMPNFLHKQSTRHSCSQSVGCDLYVHQIVTMAGPALLVWSGAHQASCFTQPDDSRFAGWLADNKQAPPCSKEFPSAYQSCMYLDLYVYMSSVNPMWFTAADRCWPRVHRKPTRLPTLPWRTVGKPWASPPNMQTGSDPLKPLSWQS